MEELSKMDQINNLAFDIMHKEMNSTEQFVYADKVYQLSLQPKLKNNQQIVLEWLKSRVEAGYPCFDAVLSLRGFNSVPYKVLNAYMMLDEKEKRQVLAAFSNWVTDEVAE